MTRCLCGKEASNTIYCKHGKDLVFFCSDSCLWKYIDNKRKTEKYIGCASRVSE